MLFHSCTHASTWWHSACDRHLSHPWIASCPRCILLAGGGGYLALLPSLFLIPHVIALSTPPNLTSTLLSPLCFLRSGWERSMGRGKMRRWWGRVVTGRHGQGMESAVRSQCARLSDIRVSINLINSTPVSLCGKWWAWERLSYFSYLKHKGIFGGLSWSQKRDGG